MSGTTATKLNTCDKKVSVIFKDSTFFHAKMLNYVSHKVSYALRIEETSFSLIESHMKQQVGRKRCRWTLHWRGPCCVVTGSSEVREKDGDDLLSVCSHEILGLMCENLGYLEGMWENTDL